MNCPGNLLLKEIPEKRKMDEKLRGMWDRANT
jgi:hypothetical protein